MGSQTTVYKNQGLTFESDINLSNNFYIQKNLAVVHKKPTPIKILSIKGGKIVNAYFEQKSTTDYNGVYKGRYIDFEAKETANKTMFPIINIAPHQIKHMRLILDNGGIAFVLIKFSFFNEVYFVPASDIINFFDKRKAIYYSYLKMGGGQLVDINSYINPVNYLTALDKFELL